MANEFLNSIPKFLPETLLFLGILSVILGKTLFKNRNNVSLYITAAFLAIVIIFTFAQSGIIPQKLFFGTIVIDSFSLFFKLLIVISALFAVYFSYVSHEIKTDDKNSAEYFIFIIGLVLGAFLMVSSVNLLMIYVSIEIVNICIYFLSAFIKGSKRSSDASLKNITFGIISSGFMLFGISILFGISGTLDLYDIGSFLSVNTFNTITLLISVLLILIGAFYKILSIPSYFTLPDIYEWSQLPVSSLISTTVLISGFGMLIRFFLTAFHNPVSTLENPETYNLINSFPWYSIISIIAILTIILSNLAAIAQDNIKRLTAFITISQSGYILLGFVLANPQGLTASLFYLIIYLINSLGLFFCIILITNKYKAENIHSIKGLVYHSPVLAISFGFFLFSLAGFPFTSGFIGKFFIFSALLNNGYLWIVILGALNMIISLYFVLKFTKNVFILQPYAAEQKFKLTTTENFILLILLIPAIFAGIYFTPLLKLAELSTMIQGL